MRKTTTISFRLEEERKKKLQLVAVKDGRTLSSLLERIIRSHLDSSGDNLSLNARQDDKRFHPRKEVLLPARWRIRQGQDEIEHDVIVRNISASGAYTEYSNGQNVEFFKKLRDESLALVARFPGSHRSVALDCRVTRFQITSHSVGVGLRFIETFHQDVI
ncbi:MAG: PilZ domain-containing protein [Deltaproteobacteria bacterium]|nr:MAG: PilZ domain-containing protein [Deltaproteobacteria bacterium]